ncbi:LacI family transcriptional regulator [Natronospirillum operosum]|uniref:LacI family transcriptional regulator n=1 Tax=Natronospirillum operosum TaxID=2759953 RepID=A0A4Z0W8U7_9GAMM|nr:ABC transporter substrate-binding protein [Natronospirillum operosum]TGG93419.1 LacI family transcriptional regulator [Natronospirillum operosum]
MKIVLKVLFSFVVIALAPLTAVAGEIAVIVKTTNSNFWMNVDRGANAALEGQSEFTYTFSGPESETAIANQINLVENAVNRGVSGIVLAPSDPEALVPAVRQAYENGIPVVIIDSELSEAADGYYQSFLSTNNCAAGELVAENMIEQVGTSGKVAVMSYVAGAGSEIGRVGCFTDYLAEHSDLEIVGPFYSQSQMGTALNQTTDVLSANSDLVGIFGANEPTAVGMGRALAQSDNNDGIVAFGFDGNEDLQDLVRYGVLNGIAVQGSFQMGEMGVRAIMDFLQGNAIDEFIDTGVVLVTPDNIDEPEAQNVLY